MGYGPGVNLEKVVFGFFVLLAATLNFGYFYGDIRDPEVHSVYELYLAVVVNVVATILKFGDRTQMGAIYLATSLVASLQLIAAAAVYIYATEVSTLGLDPHAPDTHSPLASALMRVGIAPTLIGTRGARPALRISGRRRLSRLVENVGEAPDGPEAAAAWPRA